MKKMNGMVLLVIGLVLLGVIAWIYVTFPQQPIDTNSQEYISFVSDSINDIPKGFTAVIPTTLSPTNFELTLFSPDDSGDARLRIRNKETGAVCDTENLLIENISVSLDETLVVLATYSGSEKFQTTVDIETCKTLDSIPVQ